MIIENVNSYALGLAAELVVGREQASRIHAVYQFIDQAQNEAYRAGLAEGMKNADAASASAFDNGWEYGESFGSAQRADAYDTGYLRGVRDARGDPEYADEVVAEIVADAAEYAINGEYDFDINGEYDPSNVRDSGDEQP